MSRYENNRTWWMSRTRGRKLYFAAVDNRYPKHQRPDPERTEHEFSCGFGDNIRYYAFLTADDRNEFVMSWVSAVTVKDPYPWTN